MSVETVRIRVARDVYAEIQQRADERDTLGELHERAVALYRYLEIDGRLAPERGTCRLGHGLRSAVPNRSGGPRG